MSKAAGPRAITKNELRSFLVRYHCLDNYDRLCKEGQSEKDRVKKLLRKIGCVQYDPLNVVGRNPDLVFQSRIKNYRAAVLGDLLYRERSLVDAWDKEMSIYLTSDWPYFSRIRRQAEEGTRGVLERRGQKETLLYLQQIIGEIKARGPLAAREIRLGACSPGRWGHRQISGAALDYLYTAGRLGIHSRKNAQKTYDLAENLLPGKILEKTDPFENDEDFLEWYFFRRIGGLGAHWLRNGGAWLGFYLGDSGLRRKIFRTLEEKKLIVPFTVPEIGETFYIKRKDISLLNEKEQYDGSARIIAPLDNMLWDRLMVKKVFDFEYTWEVYVPREKRKYGYYVLPVLYRNNLIARFEPVKHAKGQPLKINAWWWEPSAASGGAVNKTAKIDADTKDAVITGLQNFADYLGADGIDKKSRQEIFRRK